jgi:hypothetical protein
MRLASSQTSSHALHAQSFLPRHTAVGIQRFAGDTFGITSTDCN